MSLRDRADDVAFRLRGLLRLSTPAVRFPARRWEAAARAWPPAVRAAADALHARYGPALASWPQLLGARELREALYVLDVLDRHLAPLRTAPLPVLPSLDVGSKDGLVLPALVAAVPGPWDLVELDAHRRYLDLSTRRAHGERLARAFPGCRYIAGSVTDLEGRYGVITWFLPFVHEGPLRAWGLPRRFFAPARLLAHVLARLAPGGVLLVVNQGEGERDTQARLFAEAGVAPEPLGRIDSALSPFARPRYGFRYRATS